VIRWLPAFVLLSVFVRVAVAAPPSGYSCGDGKAIKGQGCQCPAGKVAARDDENIAVCVAAKPRVELDQPTAANACMKDRKGRYIVKVDSTPSGATVYIGDRSCGIVGTTPWSGLLNAGPAIVILEKEGHGAMTRNIDGKTARALKLLLPKASTSVGISSQADKNVEGAKLSIDGLVVGVAPIVKIVAAGRHLIELEKPGFEKYSQWIEVKANERTTISPTLKTSGSGASATAVLRVLSNTANARAWLDGVDLGPVPVDIKDIKPGEHILQVKAPGFRTKEERVALVAGQNRVVKLDLESDAAASTGKLKVVSTVPNADVFVDGALVGKVPAEKSVAAGEHFVVVRRDGHTQFEQKVRIEAGQTITLQASMKAVGKLRVLSSPAGAAVMVNGLQRGKTPLEIDVEVGSTILRLEHPGYQPFEQTLDVIGGHTHTISRELSRRK
jgi:hypothetical protein